MPDFLDRLALSNGLSVAAGVVLSVLGFCPTAIAQVPTPSSRLASQFDPLPLLLTACPGNSLSAGAEVSGAVVSETSASETGTSDAISPDTIAPEGLTPPSLWWAQSQFGGSLLLNWLAFPGSAASPRRVDLVVSDQVWQRQNYLQRYTSLTQFGTAVRSFGYSLRACNQRGEQLGAYLCQFTPDQQARIQQLEARVRSNIPITEEPLDPTEPIACQVVLNSAGAGAFSGVAPFGGSPSIPDDTQP